MSSVHTEAELRACFRDIDRDEVELAPDLPLPFVVDGAFAWAVGPRAFLLFTDGSSAKPLADQRPRGIVFHRNHGGNSDVVAMCDWCHAIRGHGAVKLLSVRADERKRVGLYLCSDLGCLARADEPPGVDDLRDPADRDERATRILQRIRTFASRRIF